MTFVTGAPGVFWGARKRVCECKLCQASTCFRIGSKLRCIRSTPTEMQSMREKDFECFANTGVNAPGIMLLSLQSWLLAGAGAAVRSEICAMQKPKSRYRWTGIASRSLGQTDTTEQVREARIPPQRVQSGLRRNGRDERKHECLRASVLRGRKDAIRSASASLLTIVPHSDHLSLHAVPTSSTATHFKRSLLRRG